MDYSLDFEMLRGGIISNVTGEMVDEKRVVDFKPTANKEVRIEPGSSLPALFLTRVILVLASSGYLSFVAWANDKRQQVVQPVPSRHTAMRN